MRPLEPGPDGAIGKAPIVAGRIPRSQHERLTAALREHDLSLSEFLRSATGAELARLDRQIAEAAGVTYVYDPEGEPSLRGLKEPPPEADT